MTPTTLACDVIPCDSACDLFTFRICLGLVTLRSRLRLFYPATPLITCNSPPPPATCVPIRLRLQLVTLGFCLRLVNPCDYACDLFTLRRRSGLLPLRFRLRLVTLRQPPRLRLRIISLFNSSARCFPQRLRLRLVTLTTSLATSYPSTSLATSLLGDSACDLFTLTSPLATCLP